MTRLTYITLAAMLLGLAACDMQKPSDRVLEEGGAATQSRPQAEEGDQEPVAIVNGEVITYGEFERRIEQLAPFARARLSSLDKRKNFLNSVVQFEVLADEAEKRGYGDDPAVIQAMKDVMVRKMIQDEVRERVSMSDISEQEVEDYYRKHRSEYRKPEARRTLLLRVETEREAQQIRGDLLDDRPEAVDDRVLAFRKLAAQLSIDRREAKQGGDVGWIDDPDARPERIKLSREVFALEEPGEVTEPFRLKDQWALASYLDRRSATEKRLDEVRQSIRTKLYEQKKKQARDAFVDELRQKARVEKHEDVLEAVEPPSEDRAPGVDSIPTIPIRDLRGERGAAQQEDPRGEKD